VKQFELRTKVELSSLYPKPDRAFTLKSDFAKNAESLPVVHAQVISLIACLLIWMLDKAPQVPLENLSFISYGSIVLSGFGVPLAYYLYLYSLRRTPVFCQMSQYLELIFGLIFSWILYQEEFHEFKIIGAGLIIVSLYFSSRVPNSN
jgi:drug/metabolite transporter (DMT)-like permease